MAHWVPKWEDMGCLVSPAGRRSFFVSFGTFTHGQWRRQGYLWEPKGAHVEHDFSFGDMMDEYDRQRKAIEEKRVAAQVARREQQEAAAKSPPKPVTLADLEEARTAAGAAFLALTQKTLAESPKKAAAESPPKKNAPLTGLGQVLLNPNIPASFPAHLLGPLSPNPYGPGSFGYGPTPEQLAQAVAAGFIKPVAPVEPPAGPYPLPEYHEARKREPGLDLATWSARQAPRVRKKKKAPAIDPAGWCGDVEDL